MVGVALVVAGMLAIGAIVLAQRDGDDPVASLPTPTTTPTATATLTVTPSVTPPATPSPAATASPTSTSDAGPMSEETVLRPDGVGDLELGMSAQQALATGQVDRDVSMVTGEETLVADQDSLPGVIVSYSPGRDAITGFMVKRGSPIQTPEGIGVGSSAADVRAAYGARLQERQSFGTTYFIVPFGDAGYASFPSEQELTMVAVPDHRLATIEPNTEI
jgi:hypothetical protein